MAQKRQFTLEDLNFGGIHYNEMSPEKRYYLLHGNVLMRKYIDNVVRVSDTGKETELFSLDDIQEAFGSEDACIGVNLLNVSFPYKDRSWVLVLTPQERLLYDYQKKEIVFSQKCTGSLEWNSDSKTDAFSRDNNRSARPPDRL